MIWFFPVRPTSYIYPLYFHEPRATTNTMPQPIEQQVQVQPFLQTWPYSNVYYGNYYDS